MQQITLTLDDQVYQVVSRETSRLNLSVDTFLSTLIMRSVGAANGENGLIDKGLMAPRSEPTESVKDEIARRIKETGSPGKALMGLFSDIPDVMDAIVADAMAARSEPWRLPNDESNS